MSELFAYTSFMFLIKPLAATRQSNKDVSFVHSFIQTTRFINTATDGLHAWLNRQQQQLQ